MTSMSSRKNVTWVVGHYTVKEYRMGQPVYIRVEQVDRELRTIDFVMMQEE